jgi:hypothetical protein
MCLLTLGLWAIKVECTVIEQRKNQRFELKLPFEIIRDGANPKARGETKNLSSTGVLFTLPTPVEIGEPIEYLITLPRTPGTRADVRLRCIGKVLRGHAQSTFAATLERYEFVRGH